MKNWRLIQIEYKIAEQHLCPYAARIKSVLTKLVSEDQSGCIPGRSIIDNIGLVTCFVDVMYYIYTEKNNIPGMILLLDCATAFDYLYNVVDNRNIGSTETSCTHLPD